MPEHEALRLIKKRDHYAAKMTDRVVQFQIAQVQIKEIWSFLEGDGQAPQPDMSIKDVAAKNNISVRAAKKLFKAK
eukprot:7212037-Alexandrium_andersonii.AAC.1